MAANTLVELLEESARKFGPRPALLFKPGFRYRQWTYSQLWEQAGQVATLLQRMGVKKEERVIIWGPNCPQWVLAFFGCLRAGAVAVPLDLRSPGEFVDLVMESTSPAAALVSRTVPGSCRRWSGPTVYFEELEALIAGLPAPEAVAVGPQDLAEVMFTSGTTSDPKGVMLTHGNIITNLQGVTEYIPGQPGYRLLSVLPLSHMFEQMGGLFSVVRCGASVTYPTSRQPSVLLRTMRERKVTNMVLVPQALELFWRGIEREAQRQGNQRRLRLVLGLARFTPFPLRRWLLRPVHQRLGGALRFVVSGGAALDPEVARNWQLLGIKVAQGYGTTETAPVISTLTLGQRRPGSVGRPLPNLRVKLAADGEIWVQGPNVMKGYWNAPGQTAAALEDGWYRTGDLGELDPAGFLQIKGRKKDMIVLGNGQNVYPEDIEAVIRKHPAVTDAAVLGLPRPGGPEVHAALLLDGAGGGPEVVAWANARLADHQQVRGHTVWPEPDFPRTHTLKVKKGLLLERLLDAGTAPVAAAPVPPVTAGGGVPEMIARLKGIPAAQVGLQQTLGNDLDLDSLGRVELLSILEEELGVYLDESKVGPLTTVAELSDLVAQEDQRAVNYQFGLWGRKLWCRTLRGTLQWTVVFPGLALMYRVRVRGRENLRGLGRPVMFAANHTLRLDNGLIIRALPYCCRRRLTIAAWDNLWTSPFQRVFIPLFGNGFPFSKQGNIRASLNNLGRQLDDRWSVLIYPEGQRTVHGPMKPFLSGIGLVAVEGRVPIVPLRLDIHRTGVPSEFPVLRRGRIDISFGKPITFPPDTPYAEATRIIEEAVKGL